MVINLKIKYKGIEHERTEDAPFMGALISADGCKFKCKNCFNRDLKKLPTKTATAKEIIAEVRENIFNEGIILGGLEWSEQPLELLELVKEASEQELKVMIYTGCVLEQFHGRLGVACGQKVGMGEIDTAHMSEFEKDMMYIFIGQQILDRYISGDYYIKCGLYDKEKLVDDNIQFGVKLASSNQRIYLIKGDTDEVKSR